MTRTLCFVLLLLTGCGGSDERTSAAPADSVRPDTAATLDTAPEPDSAPAITRAVAVTKFDPQQVKPGDEVGGLTVKRIRRPPDDYSITFTGEVELNGRYLTHPEYPEVKLPCFWVDPDSWAKLPRASTDQRLIWFCFENDTEAIRQLGPLGTRMSATIVIDNYQTALSESDVFDTAHLIRVVSKQAIK
jgi:hypothetical protein